MTQHPDDDPATRERPNLHKGSATDETLPFATPPQATPATPAPATEATPAPPAYGTPPAYGEPPVYGSSAGPAPAPPPPPPGYRTPGSTPPPAYGQPPNYGPPPAYGQPPTHGQPTSQGQPPSYGPPPTGAPGSGPPPAWGSPQGGPPPGGPPGTGVQEERQWALFAHLGGVLAIFPVIHLLPALAIYSIYQSRSDFVKDQAREALNFQIVVLIAFFAARILNVLPGFPNLTFLVWLFSLIFAVIGGVAASRGDRYRYPLTYRFLS